MPHPYPPNGRGAVGCRKLHNAGEAASVKPAMASASRSKRCGGVGAPESDTGRAVELKGSRVAHR